MKKRNFLNLGLLATAGILVLTSCGKEPNNPPQPVDPVTPVTPVDPVDPVTPVEEIIPAESVSLDKEDITVEEGLNVLLKATVLPENATDKNVIWSSLDDEIATVSQAGVVHGLKEGETTIKITHADGWIDKCNVTVSKSKEVVISEETKITLDIAELTLVNGDEATLKAEITPETLIDKTLTWNTTNPLVATVSSDGLVKAVGDGTATIIVSHGVYNAKCEVTVVPGEIVFEDLGVKSLQNEVVSEYLSKTTAKDQYNFLKEHTNTSSSHPEYDDQRYTISWEDDGSKEYRIVLSNNEDLSNPLIDKVITETSFDYGLYVPGKTYYALISSEVSSVLEAQKFTFADNEVRFINVPEIKNARDLGGWSIGTDNINYDLLYRGGCLNGKGAGKLNAEGMKIFTDDLKIRSEVDLRAFNSESNGYQSEAFYKKDAKYITVDMKEQRFDSYLKFGSAAESATKKLFETISNKDNYPLYFHCNEGASRTGTAAFFMEAILGVSYEDIIKDYELTNFSPSGSRRWRTHAYNDEVGFMDLTNLSYDELVATTPNEATGRDNCAYNIDAMYVYLMENYKGEGTTLQDAVTNYVLSCGVSQNQIDSFKQIMTDDALHDEILNRSEESIDKSLIFVTLKGLSNGDVIVPMQKGTTLNVANPKESKRIFEGWYVDELTPFDVSEPINSNMTLFAHFKECSDTPTSNKVEIFTLTEENSKSLIGDLGKTYTSEDMIEFYELKQSQLTMNLPKIKFNNYKMVEFDVMNNWQKADLSFGSDESNLVQFGKSNTRYRYSIRINCETGKMYITNILNVAEGSIVSSEITEIGYTLNNYQLDGLLPLCFGYSSSAVSNLGFKLTSLFTYTK